MDELDGGTDDSDLGGEVRLGSALFTMVEPHPGFEVAYNRWYERDHFYAGCMVGPWLFAGKRFVATPEIKQLRFGAETELFGGTDLGSFLAVYWILDGRHDEHTDWALRQVNWLHANGRMFAERDHIHTLMYRFKWHFDNRIDGVPPELALDHPFAGLGVTIIEHPDDVDADRTALHQWIQGVRPPALCLALTPIPLPEGAPVSQLGLADLDRRTLLLQFVDASTGGAWDEHRSACESMPAAVGQVLWSSPFRPTVPGTDADAESLAAFSPGG